MALSGLDHSVQAIAVDEKQNRVLIVSAEASPRSAAMMQVDVQGTMKSRVLVARPIAIDLGLIFRQILSPLGLTTIDIEKGRRFIAEQQAKGISSPPSLTIDPEAENLIGYANSIFGATDLPILPLILSAVSKAADLPWNGIGKLLGETMATGTVDFSAFIANDPLASDLAVGVCPIPLYELMPEDIELFSMNARPDEARERLRDLGILQYFQPPADQVALGLIDQGFNKEADIISRTVQSPAMGHPFGESEIVPSLSNIPDVIAEFKRMGYVAEGELGIEISQEGKNIRSNVKFRPREGFITKLINRFTLNVSASPGDFLK